MPAELPRYLNLRGHFAYAPEHVIDLEAPDLEGMRVAEGWRRELSPFGLAIWLGKNRAEAGDADMDIADLMALSCGECGKRVSFVCTESSLVAAEACEHAGGLAPYEVSLSVPSGRSCLRTTFARLPCSTMPST